MPAAWVAIPPAMMAEITTFSDFSRTSGDISAPILLRAVKTSPGSVKIAPRSSVGFSSNCNATTTSAVKMTPFSSSTGVSGGKVSTFTSRIEMGAGDGSEIGFAGAGTGARGAGSMGGAGAGNATGSGAGIGSGVAAGAGGGSATGFGSGAGSGIGAGSTGAGAGSNGAGAGSTGAGGAGSGAGGATGSGAGGTITGAGAGSGCTGAGSGTTATGSLTTGAGVGDGSTGKEGAGS